MKPLQRKHVPSVSETLRGEFDFPVLGHRLRVRRLGKAGMHMPWPSLYRARLAVLEGTWDVWRDFWKSMIESEVVRDWDGLSYEDIWRDPMIGMRLIREVRHRG